MSALKVRCIGLRVIQNSLLAIVTVGALFVSIDVCLADDSVRGGDLPTTENGQPLNFDFETGTLADWEATGEAFAKQPILGDIVKERRSPSSCC